MNAVEAALYSKLAGDASVSGLVQTRIYNTLAPEDAQMPFVVFSLASGVEENLTPRQSVRLVYFVRAVAEQLEQAGLVADAIRNALHHQPLGVPGWENYWLAQITHIRYLETDPGGRKYWHAGGEFEVKIASKEV